MFLHCFPRFPLGESEEDEVRLETSREPASPSTQLAPLEFFMTTLLTGSSPALLQPLVLMLIVHCLVAVSSGASSGVVSCLEVLRCCYNELETFSLPLSILSPWQAGLSPLVGAEVCLRVTPTHISSEAC